MSSRGTCHSLRIVSTLAWLLSGCAGDSRPDPRDTIKGFFTAIRGSDTLYIERNVDLASASRSLGDDLLPETASSDPNRELLGTLTGEGSMRKRWLESQIVVGRADLSADTAWVEVSFIDRVTRVQYYNKMRLEFRNGQWVISSFKTL